MELQENPNISAQEKNYLIARIRLKESISSLALGNAQFLVENFMAGQQRIPIGDLQLILTELEVLNRRLDTACKQIFGR